MLILNISLKMNITLLINVGLVCFLSSVRPEVELTL